MRTNLDLKGGPFRSSPVECLSGLNEMSEPTNNFLHWSRLIRTMCHNHIHIIQLKTFKRAIHSLNQMLSTQSNFIRRFLLNQSHGLREMTNPSPEQLGWDDKIVTFPSELLDGFAHGNFGCSVRVNFSTIEEIDSILPCFVHTFQCDLLADLATISNPSAKRKSRNSKTCVSKETKAMSGHGENLGNYRYCMFFLSKATRFVNSGFQGRGFK